MYCIFKKMIIISKKEQNKGQVTFYAILGLFLFIFLIIGILYYNNIKEQRAKEEAIKIQAINLRAQEIQRLVSECIRKESFEGLKMLGQTAGYIEIPTLIEYKGTAFWQFDQANIQPFLNQTHERLIEYVDKNVPKCLEIANITQYGFVIEKKEPKTFMEFGASDVTIKVIYPVKLSEEQFTKEFSEFFNTFDIRYRAIYEAATEVNERLFDEDFDIKNPLKKLDYLKSLNFDINYNIPQDDIIAFTITDKKSITPENQNYAFNFAAKLGNSTLKKITTLQNRSATNLVVLPYTIYSVDKKVQLDLSQGTTINKDGQDVAEIIVYQAYPSNVTTKDVPVHKRNDQIVQKGDLSYAITEPVYSFEPDGVRFNKLQRLTIYYDDESNTEKGVGILMGKKDLNTGSNLWVPIPSKDELENRKVYGNILGFTDFTAVKCAAQSLKQAIGENFFEPKATCYVSLAIMIIAILVMVMFIFVAPLVGAAAITGAAPGASITTVTNIGASLAGSVGFSSISAGVATAIGYAAIALSVVSTGLSVVGATTDAFWGTSPDNCANFYPLCDQNIDVQMEGSTADAQGQCVPETGQRVAAGAPSMVCAQVESCGNFIDKTLCKSCSVKCTAKYY